MSPRFLSMTRRGACAARLALLLALAGPGAGSALAAGEAPTREIAVTVDDLPGVKTGGTEAAAARRVSLRIVAALRKRGIPAVGFVNAGRSFPDDPKATREILKVWTDAGMELGNHTARHSSLHQVAVEDFLADVRDGLKSLRSLLAPGAPPVRYFRHPCLHTGRSPEVRLRVEALLRELGLTTAPVTFDNGEWIFAAAYHRAVLDGRRGERRRIANAYLGYMERKLAYFEGQSQKLLGREMPQIMLVHANRLNADLLPRLLDRLQERGYRFVSLAQVLRDPAFSLPDTYTGRGGISSLHRWAYTKGVDKEFFAGEPEVPAWILELAGVTSE